MSKRVFKKNYDGREIKEDEVMVAFPHNETDDVINSECNATFNKCGVPMRVTFKAVPKEWEKAAKQAVIREQNELNGRYAVPNSISIDAMEDEYQMEILTSRSAEEEYIEKEERERKLDALPRLLSSLVRRYPKVGCALLLTTRGIDGEEFYHEMQLSKSAAARYGKEARRILKEQYIDYDILDSLNNKSRNDDYYVRRSFELIAEVMENLT